mmetsp:Transcript_3535/g.8517  ORF Transcript_3535/g.8517 Transcript_3535/m.8517 type:complete len:223 (+) Transcript_3535:1809-2477(+)
MSGKKVTLVPVFRFFCNDWSIFNFSASFFLERAASFSSSSLEDVLVLSFKAASATSMSSSWIAPVAFSAFRPDTATPLSNRMACPFPPLSTTTSTDSDKAFTTEIPTPCNPPLTLYPPAPPRFSNFPPACKTVRTVSRALIFVFGCTSVGIPRPSSTTVQDPSGLMVVEIKVACPAKASSTELSTTSHTRWCKPSGPVDPMYMPGRFRTGSRPSKTVIWPAP